MIAKKMMIAFLIVCPILLLGQEKALLTKGETFSYLNRVLQKVKGYKCINTGFGTMTNSITNISFNEESGEAVFSYTVDSYYAAGPGDCSRGCGEGYSIINKFSPLYITNITLSKNYGKDPVYYCFIQFTKGNLVKQTIIRKSNEKVVQTRDEAGLYFFMGDNTDFEKLKKALFHLRDLYKAEDDPFGK